MRLDGHTITGTASNGLFIHCADNNLHNSKSFFLRKTVSRFRLPISASFLETLNNQAIDIVAILSRFCDYKWFWPGAVTNCDGLWL